MTPKHMPAIAKTMESARISYWCAFLESLWATSRSTACCNYYSISPDGPLDLISAQGQLEPFHQRPDHIGIALQQQGAVCGNRRPALLPGTGRTLRELADGPHCVGVLEAGHEQRGPGAVHPHGFLDADPTIVQRRGHERDRADGWIGSRRHRGQVGAER